MKKLLITILLSGCSSTATLGPEHDSAWPPKQKPPYNYGVA